MDANELQNILEPLFPGLMGVKLTEATPTRVTATMLVRPDLCTTGGVLHGGAHMASDAADPVGRGGNLGCLLRARKPGLPPRPTDAGGLR